MSLVTKPADLVARAEVDGRPGLLTRAPHWERVELGDVVEITNGAPFSSHDFNQSASGLPLIRIRDLDGWTGTSYSGHYDAAHLVEPGDLLVGMDGDFRVRRWRGQCGLLNQRVCKLRVRDPQLYDEHFLELVLPGYLAAIHADTSSVTVKHLSSRDLAAIPVPLPPILEQRRIAGALSEQLARVERSESAVRNLHKMFEALDVTVLERSARGDLTGDGAGNAPARVVTAKPSTKYDYNSLPCLPPRWEWIRADDVCESVFNGNTPRPQDMNPEHGDVPFFKVYNIDKRYGLDFSVRPTYIDRATHDGKLKRSQLRPDDVLINIVGPPMGKVAIVSEEFPEANMNQAIVAFRPGPRVAPAFLALVLRAPFVLGRLTATSKATAGQFNISLTACRELPLPIPPREEQAVIVSIAGDYFDARRPALADLHGLSERLAALRKSVVRRALAGRLVQQDPCDEPAAVLLKRIGEARADRAGAERAKKRTVRKTRTSRAPKNEATTA